MLHRVTVHSFHSDVLKTLANIDLDPDLILAFDSHLDVFMPVKSTVELFPGWIQSAATRPTVHSLIRRAFGDFPPLLKAKGMDLTELPKMVLVVPEACFKTHVYHESEKIRELLATGPISRDQSSDPIETWTWYLSQALGIEPFLSPPKNFTKLIELGKAANCVLLDVDVDYFQEMQAECYTPMSNAQPGQLGWTSQVLRLVHKIKPQIITISEAKTVAINDPDSNFSKTIDQLRRMGYKINYKRSVKDDEEAQRLIEVYRDLYENVLKPLHDRQRLEKSALSRDAIERDLTEEDEAIRQYFDHLSKSK